MAIEFESPRGTTLNLALFGPPGSGKGTQSQLLKEKLQFAHVASGDLLRKERDSGSELGNELRELMSRGDLVPDQIVDALVKHQVKRLVSENRCIVFDGYPRNLAQLQRMEEMLQQFGTDIHLAISLEIDEQDLIDRMQNRRVCPKCRKVYNVLTHPPKVEGICDDCGTEIRQRVDDQPKTISHRLEEYHRQTEPMLAYLEEISILRRVEADQAENAVFQEIAEAIKSFKPNSGAVKR